MPHYVWCSSSFSPNGSATAGGSKNQRDERAQPTPNGSSGVSTSQAPVKSRASLSSTGHVPIEKEKKADTDKVKCVKGAEPLTPEEQRKLVEDVNKLFDVRLENRRFPHGEFLIQNVV